jgi:N-acetylmuramic acid 6-phosphate etherase
MSKNSVFNELAGLITESRNPETFDIDIMSTEEIVRTISKEDGRVVPAVAKEIPYITEAVDIITNSFKDGGRLIYVGAGTSGRLGVLDAAECPPTFGSDPEMVQGIIAGGFDALVKAQEGSEDKYEEGVADLKEKHITAKDVVCGIAASQRTPYVKGALEEAKRLGAKTIAVICNPRESLQVDVDIAICPVPGPEVIMGSTRMKAATAQKMVLNMLTTTAMIKQGKVYENMMIDLQQNSQKLIERSKKIIMTTTGVEYDEAAELLQQANGHVKSAILMALTDLDSHQVKQLLEQNDGFIKKALLQWRDQSKTQPKQQ